MRQRNNSHTEFANPKTKKAAVEALSPMSSAGLLP